MQVMHSFSTLILMEHQRPHLNTLPGLLIDSLGILKRRMRHPPRSAIKLRIIALNQRDLLRALPIEVIPAMLRVRFHSQRLALAVRVDQADGDEVRFGHGVRVRDGEWVLEDLLDGPPDVDDLVTGGEEGVGVGGEVVRDAVAGGVVGLVNVDTVDGAAEHVCWGALVLGRAPDGVVEYEDAGGAGAEGCIRIVEFRMGCEEGRIYRCMD